ncbi:substrate-binding domain-containing protein [Stratiformator vulcanicus]|uniref:D-allose transporter subunit n=1 Tax=Stratiformator vulcanicus TaxID=2527980 RepID=A0A517QXN9_9PLAN|nr:substrate-binding domain-containing protein [Stratiformator vulcanicus]QDT36367.1 D-allose transporter subunit [Stratiformator vulcanicus]
MPRIQSFQGLVSFLTILFGSLIAVLVGCSPGEDVTTGSSVATAESADAKRFIILTNVADPFWDSCEVGAREAAKELNLDAQGYRVQFEQNSEGTITSQIRKLQQWAGASDVAGVALSVLEPQNPALLDAIQLLRDNDIPVVTIDSDIDRENPAFRKARYGYIGTDNVEAGKELGKALAAIDPDGGKYAVFVGSTVQANAVQRHDGVAMGLGDGYEEADFLSDDTDKSKARQNVRDALDRTADIDVLVGLWAYNMPAIADVVTEQGIREQVTIGGFDASPLALEEMKNGNIDVLVVQNPYRMGYLATKALYALTEDEPELLAEIFPNHDEPDGDIVGSGLKLVVPSKESPVTADILKDSTEFLTYDEFRAWLDKYGLTSS